MQLGVIGWGRMGGNMVRRLLSEPAHSAVVYDRAPAAAQALGRERVRAAADLAELVAALAPPRAIWVMLPAGAATVGTAVDMKHLGATPLGMQVRAKATLLETDGKRFVFSVEVWDEKEKVAESRHERFLVNDLAKFLARAMKKAETP